MVKGELEDVRSTRCLDHALHRVGLNNDTVLAQLFLNKDDLFRAFDDEIPTRVERAFAHLSQLGFGATCKYAFVAPEHDGKTPYVHIRPSDDILPSRILNGDENGSTVRRISQTALVGCNTFVDRVCVCAVGKSDMDVGVL